MCLFLEDFFRKYVATLEVPDSYLQGILEACRAANAFMRTLYAGGLFLPRRTCTVAGQHGIDFLCAYLEIAQLAHDMRKTRFKIQPKLHAALHLIDALCQVSEKRFEWGWNPLADGTQLDEDMVGKVASLSQAVSTRSVHSETLSRYLVNMWRYFDD